MTSLTTVKLRVADLALIKGVILTLASLNGDEIVVLGEILNIVDPILEENGVAALDPKIRDSDVGRVEIEIHLSQQQLVMIRGQLFAKVKAFTAGDIKQVIAIRGVFDEAITAATAKAG